MKRGPSALRHQALVQQDHQLCGALTTAGTYVEMASRLTEPVLLGLAALAVRGRVKR